MFAALLLHEGLLKGGDLLVDWILTRWSGQQIDAAMEYVFPLSLVSLALSLALTFASKVNAKKR